MASIIQFFKWLWNGIVEMFNWLRSIPTILVSSIVAFATTVNSLSSSLSSQSSSIVSDAVGLASGPISTVSGIIQTMPDIVKMAFYALSLDVLYRFVISAFILFVSATVLVLQFQLVSILSFLAIVYTYKMVAWFINAFFPSSWSISGVKSIASVDSPKQVEIIDV